MATSKNKSSIFYAEVVIELSTYKNIPVADELDAFPGERPKWKGATIYLKHKAPTVEETPKTIEGETSGDSLGMKEEELTLYQQFNTRRRRRYDATIPKATVTAPKRINPSDDSWEDFTPDLAYRKHTEAPKPSASAVLETGPSSRANKRKRTEPESDISDK